MEVAATSVHEQKRTSTMTSTTSILSLFVSLPYELQKRIVLLYLNPTDAVHLSIVLSSSDIGVNNNRINIVPLRPISLLPPNGSLELRAVGSHDETSSTPQRYEPRIHLPVSSPKRLHSVTLRTSWKDQGWGYRKGEIFIIASPKPVSTNITPPIALHRNSNDTLDDASVSDGSQREVDSPFVEPPVFDGGHVVARSTAVSPHDWEDVELTFYPNNHANTIDSDEQQEYYYHLWYRIGGGGGHLLHLRSTTVQFYVFDDVNCTYQTIYDKLLSAGCIGYEDSSLGPPRWSDVQSIDTMTDSAEDDLGVSGHDIPSRRLLSICESFKNKLLDKKQNVVNVDDQLLNMLLNEYGILLTSVETIDAIIELIRAYLHEQDHDWYIHNENCRKRLQINNHNMQSFVERSDTYSEYEGSDVYSDYVESDIEE